MKLNQETINTMKSFKEYVFEFINESALDRLFGPQKKLVSVLISRFQPVHLGHEKIINSMSRPLIVLIKGKKTTDNPFPQDYQLSLMRQLFGKRIRVIVSNTPYLPEIFANLRTMGLEPTLLYVRSDKYNKYKKQVDDFNKTLDNQDNIFDVNFFKTPKDISQKKVRATLMNNDDNMFKKLMPKKLWGEFGQMLKFIHKA